MSNTLKAFFGEIEFGYLCIGRDTSPIAVVHKIDAAMDVADEESADALLGTYDSYIIPSLNKHEIVFANEEAAKKWAQEKSK